MKRSALFLLLFVIFTSNLFSQTEKGQRELSLSGMFGSFSESVKSPNYNREDKSTTYMILALRLGFFLTKEFELEPEVLLTTIKNTEPSINLSANVSYNLGINESNITPFILAGYGIGNSIPILNMLFGRTSNKLDIGNLNLGGGMKIFVTKQVAAKVEYRYQHFSYDTDNYGGGKTEYKINSHRLLVGFSIFL